MIGKGDYRAVHIDLLGSVAGALSSNGIAPATLQSVRDALAKDDTVTAMQEEIAKLRKVAEAAYEEERTKLDANQYATEQARVTKLTGLREAGYGEQG